MSRKHFIFVFAAAFLCSAVFAAALEQATREECIAKCKEVAVVLQEKGREAAIAAVQDENGPFVWKDTYVFLVNTEGLMLAHPIKPGLVGKNIMNLKDVKGKMFVAEYVAIGRDKGEGWVEYMWPKPDEKDPVEKITCVYRIPDTDVIALAGIYK